MPGPKSIDKRSVAGGETVAGRGHHRRRRYGRHIRPANGRPSARRSLTGAPLLRRASLAYPRSVAALSHLFVHVTSLEATRHFYVDFLGLEPLVDDGLYLRVGGPNGFHIGFEERDWADVGAPGVEIAIRVDDVDETYRLLRAEGVRFGAPPEDQEWGARHVWLLDPDDYRLTLWSPIAT